MLDIEPIDLTASNYEQRIARKKFYQHNGCSDSGYRLRFMGNPFEILYTGKDFNKQGLIELLEKIKPELDKYLSLNFEIEILKLEQEANENA